MTAFALAVYRSSVGKKYLMAATGAGWVFFLIAHLFSNLHVFLGPESLNSYYAGLKASPEQLWGIRATLFVGIAVHVWTAFLLVKNNADAKPQRYAVQNYRASSYAARTMKWSGPILLLYIIFHLLHFTVGKMPGEATHDSYDIYGNMVNSFRYWYVSLSYMLAMGAVCLHLYHGIWSFFRSFGIDHPKFNAGIKTISVGVTVLITAGYFSIPLAVMTGFLK